MQLCLDATLHPQDSYHWWMKAVLLGQRPLIERPEWHKWLFGGEDPPGVFVVSERLQRLRDLRSQRGILKTASIDARLLTYWNEHPHLKAGLEDMRLSVRSPRASIQPGGPAWQAKHSKV